MAFAAAAQDPFDPPIGNLRAIRAAGLPAVGGAGSARGLARLLACCISRVDDEPPLLEPDTVAAMTQIQTAGEDLVLGMPTRFAVVFQKADGRLRYGSHQAFGHDGAAGAIAIADPWHDLAYGHVPRRMSLPGGADERGLRLAATVRACRQTEGVTR
jgi:CubicO group peptidase (beta-lactamase class C family)